MLSLKEFQACLQSPVARAYYRAESSQVKAVQGREEQETMANWSRSQAEEPKKEAKGKAKVEECR